MDQPGFCPGFAAGFLLAGIIGFVMQQILLASKRGKEATTKQRVVAQTERTPMEAVSRWIQSWFLIIFWLVVLAALVGIGLWLLSGGSL